MHSSARPSRNEKKKAIFKNNQIILERKRSDPAKSALNLDKKVLVIRKENNDRLKLGPTPLEIVRNYERKGILKDPILDSDDDLSARKSFKNFASKKTSRKSANYESRHKSTTRPAKRVDFKIDDELSNANSEEYQARSGASKAQRLQKPRY